NGLQDYLASVAGDRPTVTEQAFAGKVEREGGHGTVEWAALWGLAGFGQADGFCHSYCNTIPTPEGGTHEAGLRAALTKGLKAYGELAGVKKAAQITAEDVMGTAGAMLSVFVRNPEFQGQTKDKLATVEAQKLVETAVRDRFDHWLAAQPTEAGRLLDWVVERAEERARRRREKEISRQSAVRKLRLPGKLADCTRGEAAGTEIFLVEGDSAGGSAKQARARATQAVLPLRGKILNVASAGREKIDQNQELSDLIQALGCGVGARYRREDLRYEKVIIMTDADVDGAHIASLLITFFHRATPQLIRDGHLYLAQPPLLRLVQGGKSVYARDEAHRDEMLKSEFKANAKVEVSRFKGLGEMMPAELKTTTMDPATRALAQVKSPMDDATEIDRLVEQLMGRKAEGRFQYIQENAEFVGADELDI
ncbi:MAG: toprim domain-containing protein, partial [Pseudomonadota bacterium]